MSQQIQITGGAKVRNLEGVLTGTSGVVNSLAINVPNGIPQLDGSGKILVSQLPNSVMEYKGSWNAATNTPTLVNGTGNAGDVYLCEVAGTVNFGAGPIAFFVGDQVVYSGTIWQRASGATGTVTSVSVTESGDALTITGSPITTSGTINIGFTGTSGQYVNGAGGLTTFPSLTGFVPYTGATANVDLGAFDLTATGITANSFYAQGNGTQGGYLYLKQGIVPYGTLAGSNSISADGTKYIYLSDAGSNNSKTAIFQLGSISNNIERTYTLPDLSGTLALLEGTQTFSGAKTFTASTGFTFLNGTRMDYGLYLSKGAVPSAFTSLTTNIYSDATTNNIVIRDNSSIAKLEFNNSTQTYTFPAASGTIALTSDLSSYVPYTGAIANVDLGIYALSASNFIASNGNLTSTSSGPSGFINSLVLFSGVGFGNLFGVDGAFSTKYFGIKTDGSFIHAGGNASFSGTLTASSYRLTGMTAGAGALYWLSDRVTLANYNASGVVHIEANGGTGVATFGGATYNNDFVGTGRFTGPLSGTSATFSGIVNGLQGIFKTTGVPALQLIRDLDVTIVGEAGQGLEIGARSGASFVAAGAIYGVLQNPATNGSLVFNTLRSGTLTNALILASTGDATFIGEIFAQQNIRAFNAIQFRYNNIFRGQILPYNAYGGGSDFSPFFTSESTLAFGVSGNATKALMIASGGNVLIGGTTDYGLKCQVYGVVASVNNAVASYASSNATTYGWFNSGAGTLILTNSGVANVGQFSMATGIYTPTSDKNKKKDFQDSNIGLKEILMLKPTLYRMKNQDESIDKELGFIAQEVKEFIPQAYVENEDFIGLNDMPIIAALVKAIQEQQAQIESQDAKIEELKALIAAK